jgi:hypothetical protein
MKVPPCIVNLRTCVGGVRASGGVSLLDSEAASEWASEGVVTAANGANIAGGGYKKDV